MSNEQTKDYTEFKGSRARMVYKDTDTGDLLEVFGVVDAVNTEMSVLMFREKGKTIGFLVELDSIDELEVQAEPLKPLKQKALKPITAAQARQHLLDRHEWELGVINATDDESALKAHDEIDHSLLGHTHEEQTEDSSDNDTPQAAE
jgi:hypothetical protein